MDLLACGMAGAKMQGYKIQKRYKKPIKYNSLRISITKLAGPRGNDKRHFRNIFYNNKKESQNCPPLGDGERATLIWVVLKR